MRKRKREREREGESNIRRRRQIRQAPPEETTMAEASGGVEACSAPAPQAHDGGDNKFSARERWRRESSPYTIVRSHGFEVLGFSGCRLLVQFAVPFFCLRTKHLNKRDMAARSAIFFFCAFFFLLQVTPLMLEENEENEVAIRVESEASWKIFEEEFNVHHHRVGHKDPDGYLPSRVHEVHCSRRRSRVAREVMEKHLMPFVEAEEYQLSRKCGLHLNVNDGKCLADLCGALHCDLVMYSKIMRYRNKPTCDPDAAGKNLHFCESLADSCFPAHEGSSASRLHDLFMRQFCDAHTCSVGPKPFSIIVKKHTSNIHLAMPVLILLLILCIVVELQKSWTKKSIQD